MLLDKQLPLVAGRGLLIYLNLFIILDRISLAMPHSRSSANQSAFKAFLFGTIRVGPFIYPRCGSAITT